MKETVAFVENRAGKTIAAATNIAAKWVYPGKTTPQIQALLTAIVGDKTTSPPLPGQEGVASAAKKTMEDSRHVWDAGLDQLHVWTMNGIALARTHFADQSTTLALLDNLSATGDSRQGILDEALAWSAAWNQADPTYVPLPGVTLAAFDAQRVQCLTTLQNDYNNKYSAWRDQVGILGQMAADLEKVLVAWYSDATRIFPAGTPEGDMIRGTIPTTYTPASNATPPTPAPTPTPKTPKTP
jgi:hypothetical protein